MSFHFPLISSASRLFLFGFMVSSLEASLSIRFLSSSVAEKPRSTAEMASRSCKNWPTSLNELRAAHGPHTAAMLSGLFDRRERSGHRKSSRQTSVSHLLLWLSNPGRSGHTPCAPASAGCLAHCLCSRTALRRERNDSHNNTCTLVVQNHFNLNTGTKQVQKIAGLYLPDLTRETLHMQHCSAVTHGHQDEGSYDAFDSAVCPYLASKPYLHDQSVANTEKSGNASRDLT